MTRQLFFFLFTLLVIASGCGLPPKMTLEDINPVRVYPATKEQLFEAVRDFATRENYKVERFELETGAIKGHKVLSTRSRAPGRNEISESRHMLMILRSRALPPGNVELNASFGYADYQGTFTSEDEGILVSEYNNLFSFLEEALKK